MKELSITYNMAYFGETFSTVKILELIMLTNIVKGMSKEKKKQQKAKTFLFFLLM